MIAVMMIFTSGRKTTSDGTESVQFKSKSRSFQLHCTTALRAFLRVTHAALTVSFSKLLASRRSCKTVKNAHILRIKLEIENVRILYHAIKLLRFEDHGHAFLQTPTSQDLRDSASMFGSHTGKFAGVKRSAIAQYTICLNSNTALLKEALLAFEEVRASRGVSWAVDALLDLALSGLGCKASKGLRPNPNAALLPRHRPLADPSHTARRIE